MATAQSRLKSAVKTEIAFPLMECWNPITSVATILAIKDGKRICCGISEELLQTRFSASGQPPMTTVAQHRPELHAAARTLIERRAFEADGSIMIRRDNI